MPFKKMVEVLEKHGNLWIDNIRQNMIKNDQMATGETAQSFRLVTRVNGLTIYGRANIKSLEVGSGQGAWIGIAKLKRWMQARGINLKFVYAIQATIYKLGTRLYRDKKVTGTINDAIDIEALKKDLAENYKITITNDLKNALNSPT